MNKNKIKTSNGMKRVPHEFFNRKTLIVAKELLGKYLVRKVDGQIIREKITEIEAYIGPHDLACHASRGKTFRNTPMFNKPGTIYVYFTYGMHWMLNIVTEEEGFPSAVLIRGTKSFSGPGRLTKNLKIDKALNNQKLGAKSGLWIEYPSYKLSAKSYKLIRTPRIGINSTPEPWLSAPYRFKLEIN